MEVTPDKITKYFGDAKVQARQVAKDCWKCYLLHNKESKKYIGFILVIMNFNTPEYYPFKGNTRTKAISATEINLYTSLRGSMRALTIAYYQKGKIPFHPNSNIIIKEDKVVLKNQRKIKNNKEEKTNLKRRKK